MEKEAILPIVTVIIPARNEEKYIAKCLESFIENDYKKENLEILVVDGMSNDQTREIVKEYSAKYQYIKLLDNPKKITPSAFNIGIANAKGDVIIIVSAHAVYRKDYISKCVRYLYEFEADNVGGTIANLQRNDTLIAKSIGIALAHRFGVGGATFRTGTKEPKWVDTVFGGCYRKDVFSKVGMFDENLIRSQDIEFNIRLRNAGGKILLHPDIVTDYYAYSDLGSFIKSNYSNGLWTTYPLKFVTHIPVRLRHLIPLMFILGLFGSGILSVFWHFFIWLFLLVAGAYTLANAYFSVRISLKEKSIKYIFIMPFIFAILHLTYGVGSLWGLLRSVFSVKFWENRFIAEHKKRIGNA